MFVDGAALDEVFETSEGYFCVIAVVRVDGDGLTLSEFWIYPATGAREEVGVGPLLEVVGTLKRKAREQGLSHFTVEGERMYRDGRRRIIDCNGRVR